MGFLDLFKYKCKKRKTSEPYSEKDTECDKCYKLSKCIKEGYVVNCTYSLDTREHYIKGRNCVCIKGCEEFLEMKLSEILKVADTEEMKQFIQKAIEQLGDMTYREFYQEGRFLEMR